jgi:RNA polymerase sigma-70 factor (ECF subfamily)
LSTKRKDGGIAFAERIERTPEHLEDLDTARLVTRFQAGDADSFTALYRRYFDRVYGYLRVAFRDAHQAEDAAQQVFTQVFEALPRYERRRQPFRAWLFRIVRNHTLAHLRKEARTEATDPTVIDEQREANGDREPATEDLSVLAWISDRDLMMFAERLPLAQRQVLVLRYMLDMTDVEIAEVLGRSAVDVRTLQHRALRFLEARLRAVGRAPARRERAPWRRRTRQAPVLRRRRFAIAAPVGGRRIR